MKENKVDRLLSSGNVAIMSTKPTEVKVDKVDATPVKPEALSKEELIKVVQANQTAIKNYEQKLQDTLKNHDNELKNMNEYYGKKIKEMSSLISYYERKLKLIKDLIDIEGGE